MYLLTGSDFDYASKCLEVLLESKIPISAIGGESTTYLNDKFQLLERFPSLTFSSITRPWKNAAFLAATSGNNMLGIAIGLDAIVPSSFLENRFIINTHPSALPFNKGSHQSFWAIMDSTLGGGSIHLMTHNLDEGPILFQETFKISERTTSRQLQLMQLDICIKLLQKHILDISRGNFELIPQDFGSKHFKNEIVKATTLLIGETIEVETLLRLCRATCNKGNGFSIKTVNGTFKVAISDVSYREN